MAHLKFQMPCLSKYTFFSDGKMMKDGKLRQPKVTSSSIGYYVMQDNGKTTFITILEIIQYGKQMSTMRP